MIDVVGPAGLQKSPLINGTDWLTQQKIATEFCGVSVALANLARAHFQLRTLAMRLTQDARSTDAIGPGGLSIVIGAPMPGVGK